MKRNRKGRKVTLILYGGRRRTGPKAVPIGTGAAEKRGENGFHLFLDEAIEVVEFADAIAMPAIFVDRRAALVDGVPRVFASGFSISASFVVAIPSVAGFAGFAGVTTVGRRPNVQKPPDVIV